MKRRIFALLAVIALAAGIASAQTPVPPNLAYTWTATTGTAGQLGNYLTFTGSSTTRPSNYTIDVSVSGTAPAACTFRVEGSSDGSVWYGLDVTSPSTTSCTSSYMESIISRPVLYLRVYLTYTQGDATTVVKFHYTGKR